MKPIERTITTLALVVMLFAGLAHAQYPISTVKVDVPFEFAVGNRTFAAGSYSVVRSAPTVLALRDARENVVAILITAVVQANAPRDTPKLDFRTVGGEHVLTQIWFGNSAFGNQLTPQKRNLTMAKAPAGKKEEEAKLP